MISIRELMEMAKMKKLDASVIQPSGDTKVEETHPKTEKEKKLAKLAPPHDKITHADVMVGRGVKKEEAGASKKKEDEFHVQLDKLVHKTFGKGKHEMEEMSSKEKMKRGLYNKEELETSPMDVYLAAIEGQADFRSTLSEKKLTPAELKKREEIAQAMERDNPGMDMSKKMAIATAQAKKVAEESELEEAHQVVAKTKEGETFKSGVYPTKEKAMDMHYKMAKSGKYAKVDTVKVQKEEVELTESHFKIGDKVECIDSGMHGTVVLLDKQHGEDTEKYYTVMRADGQMMKYAPNDLELVTMAEEVEQLDELSKSTLASYAKKASHDIRDKTRKSEIAGGMSGHSSVDPEIKRKAVAASDQLNRKAVKRVQGVTKAINRLAEEEVEQLDELSKKTLGSYIKSAGFDSATRAMAYGAETGGEEGKKTNFKQMIKREKGVRKAVDRLTKEESDIEEAMISYGDFMDKIAMHRKAGNKVVDHKYSSGKAHYTTVDGDGHGRKVTHTPAGQKVEKLGKMSGDDDEAAEVQPTEKRGRGRPAGSKSGGKYK